jgi:enoyl-[acyl-carrier protein] reductase I
MTREPEWRSNESLPVGKGATVQQFLARVGDDELEIDVSPWGEGHLKVNGREISHVRDAKNRRQAFRDLKKIADRYVAGQESKAENKRSSPCFPW